MDIVVSTLFGVGAAVVWFVLAGTLALLAGRVIHERDVHDRPVIARTRTPAAVQR